jgi:hypothetical protein
MPVKRQSFQRTFNLIVDSDLYSVALLWLFSHIVNYEIEMALTCWPRSKGLGLPINPNDIPCVSIWSTRASFDRKIVSAKNSKRLSVQLTHLVKLRADDMPRVLCIYVLLEYESNGKEG